MRSPPRDLWHDTDSSPERLFACACPCCRIAPVCNLVHFAALYSENVTLRVLPPDSSLGFSHSRRRGVRATAKAFKLASDLVTSQVLQILNSTVPIFEKYSDKASLLLEQVRTSDNRYVHYVVELLRESRLPSLVLSWHHDESSSVARSERTLTSLSRLGACRHYCCRSTGTSRLEEYFAKASDYLLSHLPYVISFIGLALHLVISQLAHTRRTRRDYSRSLQLKADMTDHYGLGTFARSAMQGVTGSAENKDDFGVVEVQWGREK